jgi:glucose 1-dehydrogenase
MGVLEGKVAVITGGTRGFGLAIAQAYGRQGAAIVLASRSAEPVERAVASLRAEGVQASGLTCDVGDVAQVEALAAHAVNTFGHFDIWVNNAGVAAPYGPTIHIPPEAYVRAVQTNVLGTYYGSLVALRYSLPRRAGKLINLLGRGDREPVPMQTAYAASKAWVRNFTLALAREYQASGVGIFAFNPGLMFTDLMTRIEAVAGYEERLEPLKMVMRLWANPPEVPARKAVWLASSATDGRTGLEVRELTPARLAAGLLHEAIRRLAHRPVPPVTLTVRTVPSALPPLPSASQITRPGPR